MVSEAHRFQRGIWVTLLFTFLLWFIKAIEVAFEIDFTEFGILPRHLYGMFGIITGPLVHGDIFHLISNTFPLIILGIGLFYFYHKIAFEVILIIYLMTGFWVWLAAREAYHIGISGIVYGLLSFLLFSGFIRRDSKSLSVSFIVLLIYGGNMIYGIFPTNSGVSWESHLLGAISGLFCAIFFRKAAIYYDSETKEEAIDGFNVLEIDTIKKSKFVYNVKSKKNHSISDDKPENVTSGYNYKVDKKDLF
jgi:membrane associated rhomboid family serine protease